MKKLSRKWERSRRRMAKIRKKMQMEMMELYKREKANFRCQAESDPLTIPVSSAL